MLACLILLLSAIYTVDYRPMTGLELTVQVYTCMSHMPVENGWRTLTGQLLLTAVWLAFHHASLHL